MSPSEPENLDLSRRRFLACGFLAAVTAGLSAHAAPASVAVTASATSIEKDDREPFWGKHQGGVLTPIQRHTYFAAFDFVTTERNDIIALVQAWTAATARMTGGQTAGPLGQDGSVPAADSGDALGLSPARLTVNFGFGAGLFVKDGQDRFGLAARRPPALVDLPKFTGDQLLESRTGGDLSVQACADDPQVAFHAIRQLARLAYDVAKIRWVQTGFNASFNPPMTPRNLMGFKDGTNNPSVNDAKLMDKYVWVALKVRIGCRAAVTWSSAGYGLPLSIGIG